MKRYRIMHGFKEYNPNGEWIYYDDAQDALAEKDKEIAALVEARASDNRASDKMITTLKAEVERLRGIMRDFLGIVYASRGIDGWHMNGDVLLWSQCEQVLEMEEALKEAI